MRFSPKSFEKKTRGNKHEIEREFALIAVYKDPQMIFRIPVKWRTQKMINLAVLTEPMMFHKFAEYITDLDVIISVIRSDASNFGWVQPELKTPKIAMVAVEKHPSALAYLHNHMITVEMIKRYADIDTVETCRFIPDHLLTRDLILHIIDKHLPMIVHSSSLSLSDNFLIKFIEVKWEIIKYIPSHRLNSAIALAAVKINGKALRYIPANRQTIEVRDEAMKSDPNNRRYIKRT